MDKKDKLRKYVMGTCLLCFFISIGGMAFTSYGRWRDSHMLGRQQAQLMEQKAAAKKEGNMDARTLAAEVSEEIIGASVDTELKILPEYQSMHEQNKDLIGWLSIEGTVIDYPVMQTLEHEDYYLYNDFYGNYNANGCLIMDTDSAAGIGTEANGYVNGTPPSTNLIIHGHNMKSGEMFGDLDLYAQEGYGKEHRIICFDSLYEHREYELVAVFYSQVYRVKDNVFKYYKFFEADTPEEFEDWCRNIKQLSLYDTGLETEFGDEFITLNCCSYHVENGRFVVVGKRIGTLD